ncbi:MAG: transcriptional regulator, MarR family [Variovorax sp.]|jgi:MarR family transcriptional regulator for hemolysin|nr:transcriptional regulator, MarR family [Variovorax sp.]
MKSPADRPEALMIFANALPVLQRGYRAAADKAVVHIGLSQAMAWPLVMAGRLGSGVRPGVLAEVLAVEGPSLVRQLDQLVEAGMIDRREDAVDRRAKTIHLTPVGNRARAKIEAALDTLRESLFEGVSDDDMAACLRVFGVLQSRLDRTARSAATSRP